MSRRRYYRKRGRSKKNIKTELAFDAVLFGGIGVWLASSGGKSNTVLLFLGIALLCVIPIIFAIVQSHRKKQKYLNSPLALIDKFTGEEFEEYLKAHFEKLGYSVKLTPKTADYGVDLICKKLDKSGKWDIFAVQAKRYNGKVGVSAIQQVIGGMKYYDCERGYVITNSYFTNNAWELANKSNITLWDRKTLMEKFKL